MSPGHAAGRVRSGEKRCGGRLVACTWPAPALRAGRRGRPGPQPGGTPPGERVPMIAKTFAPENGAKSFVIMKRRDVGQDQRSAYWGSSAIRMPASAVIGSS